MQHLLKHYNTFEKASELIALGGISSLCGNLEDTKDISYVAMGEPLSQLKMDSISEIIHFCEEYDYFFMGGKWRLNTAKNSYIELTEADCV